VPETGSTNSANPMMLAPLPIPVVNTAFKPIRPPRRIKRTISSTALVPLFYAAILFLAGIVFARFVYLRPGLLLASLLPLAVITILAIARAPRLF
jgi:hypothetical protein